jgi:2-methylisocitrate lyase-like PEP mutase family enzyme
MGGIAASIGGALGAPDATTVTFNTTPPVVRPIDVVTSTPVSLTTPITPVP